MTPRLRPFLAMAVRLMRRILVDGPQPPLLDYGINDIFVEKASVVWYWYRGKWLQLQGAD